MIAVNEVEVDDVAAHAVAQDLDHQYELPKNWARKSNKVWKPYFDPKEFWKSKEDHNLESYVIKNHRLKILGKVVTQLRQIMVDRAQVAADKANTASSNSIKEVQKQGKKIRNRGYGEQVVVNEIKPSEYREPVAFSHRRRSRTKNKVQLNEKIEIVHEVLCKLVPLKQVAKKHRIS